MFMFAFCTFTMYFIIASLVGKPTHMHIRQYFLITLTYILFSYCHKFYFLIIFDDFWLF